jgi:hypothetical protein
MRHQFKDEWLVEAARATGVSALRIMAIRAKRETWLFSGLLRMDEPVALRLYRAIAASFVVTALPEGWAAPELLATGGACKKRDTAVTDRHG